MSRGIVLEPDDLYFDGYADGVNMIIELIKEKFETTTDPYGTPIVTSKYNCTLDELYDDLMLEIQQRKYV